MILRKERQLVFCKLWAAQWDKNHAVSLALKGFPGGGQLMRTAPLLTAYRYATGFWRPRSGQLLTALSWSCSLWDGQATRWEAKLAPCHPQVWRAQMASLLPHPHWLNPTPQLSIPPPRAVPQLQALLLQHWAGPCKTLLFLSQNVHLGVISLSQV